jgi:hypothetical protein
MAGLHRVLIDWRGMLMPANDHPRVSGSHEASVFDRGAFW